MTVRVRSWLWSLLIMEGLVTCYVLIIRLPWWLFLVPLPVLALADRLVWHEPKTANRK